MDLDDWMFFVSFLFFPTAGTKLKNANIKSNPNLHVYSQLLGWNICLGRTAPFPASDEWSQVGDLWTCSLNWRKNPHDLKNKFNIKKPLVDSSLLISASDWITVLIHLRFIIYWFIVFHFRCAICWQSVNRDIFYFF